MDRNTTFLFSISINQQIYSKFVELFKQTETKSFSQSMEEEQRIKKSSSFLFLNDIYKLAKDCADKISTFKQLKKRIQQIEKAMRKIYNKENMEAVQIDKRLIHLVQIYQRYHKLTNLLSQMPTLDLKQTQDMIDKVFKGQEQKKIGQVIIYYKNCEIQLQKLKQISKNSQDQAKATQQLITILKDIEQCGVTNGIPFKFEPTKNQKLNKQLTSFTNYLSQYMIQLDKNNFATDFIRLLLDKQGTFEQKQKKLMSLSPLKKQFVSPCFQLFKQSNSLVKKLTNLIPKKGNKKDDELLCKQSVNKDIDTNNQELVIKRLNSQLSEYAKKDKVFSDILAQNQVLKQRLKNSSSKIDDNSNRAYKKYLMNASCIFQGEQPMQENNQKQEDKFLSLLKQKQILQKRISSSRSSQRQMFKKFLEMEIKLKREAQMYTDLLQQYDRIVQQNAILRNNNISIKQQYQILAQRFKSIFSQNKLETNKDQNQIKPTIPNIRQVKITAKSTIFVSSDDSSDDLQFLAKQQELVK